MYVYIKRFIIRGYKELVHTMMEVASPQSAEPMSPCSHYRPRDCHCPGSATTDPGTDNIPVQPLQT